MVAATPGGVLHTRVVFLDVDGVLNHSAVYAACTRRQGHTRPADWIDRQCVARVNALCERARAVLVISSIWPSYLGNDPFVAVMRECGLLAPIVGFCSDSVPNGTDPEQSNARWDLIRQWLSEHPGVESWVILDDCDWAGFPANRFVLTSQDVGLTDADADRAVSILNHQQIGCDG